MDGRCDVPGDRAARRLLRRERSRLPQPRRRPRIRLEQQPRHARRHVGRSTAPRLPVLGHGHGGRQRGPLQRLHEVAGRRARCRAPARAGPPRGARGAHGPAGAGAPGDPGRGARRARGLSGAPPRPAARADRPGGERPRACRDRARRRDPAGRRAAARDRGRRRRGVGRHARTPRSRRPARCRSDRDPDGPRHDLDVRPEVLRARRHHRRRRRAPGHVGGGCRPRGRLPLLGVALGRQRALRPRLARAGADPDRHRSVRHRPAPPGQRRAARGRGRDPRRR